MLRAVLGIVVGIVAGFAAVMVTQALVNLIYPLPSGINVFDRQQMAEIFRGLSAGHLALVVLTYLVGGFAGGYVARLIARRRWAAWVPAGLIALTAAVNVFTYPHPIWAQIGGILAPLLGGWLAARMAGPREEEVRTEGVDAQI